MPPSIKRFLKDPELTNSSEKALFFCQRQYAAKKLFVLKLQSDIDHENSETKMQFDITADIRYSKLIFIHASKMY